jgi:phosphotransferase system HPr (HPr) family protein
MRSTELTVQNRVGLHARPAAVFVKTACRFKCAVSVQNRTAGSPAVNAKSILSVLTLGVEKGHSILVTADGPDEVEALAALQAALADRCGEAE